MQKNEVDNSIYDHYSDRWYTAFDDPVALLRAETLVKLPWTLQQIKNNFTNLRHVHVLDVGCGGGFLSNGLAQNELKVTGVDLSESSLATAKRFDKTKSVSYLKADAYQLPFADHSFEVVTAMDFLEHVEQPEAAIREFSRVLKPGGLFIFHTFNRNWLAYFVVIKLVELLVKNTPKNMHVLRLFITPSELADYCKNANLKVLEMAGIRPLFATIPIKNIFSGLVPETLKFTLTESLKISYIGCASKDSLTDQKSTHLRPQFKVNA